MILRLSVHDTATQETHDIEVEAEPDSSNSSLLAALPFPVDGRPCYVGVEPLDPAGTLAAGPLAPGAVLSVGAPGPELYRLPYGAAGALSVLVGPDAGQVAWLAPGSHVIGRGPEAAVYLRDPKVSGRHARVEVTESGAATVTDLSPAHGTTVDGARATEPVPLPAGATLEIGDNRLRWRSRPDTPLPITRSRDARLDFDRAYAPAPAISRIEVPLPTAEPTAHNVAVLLTSGLLPLVIGGVMAVVLRQPAMLLFAVLGPVSAGGSYLVERRQRRRRSRAFADAKGAAEVRVSGHLREEERLRRMLAPDHVDLTFAATGVGPGLWPRNADSPDGLVLRVGTADQPASVDLRGEPWPEIASPTLPAVPITVDLRATGVLGVVGPAEPVNALLRWLIVQLGTLRSPDDLRIAVITSSDDAELAWSAWLPHIDAGEAGQSPCWTGNTRTSRAARIDELRQIVASRLTQRGHAVDMRFAEDVVAVLDGALALRHLPGMKEVLRDGPSVGVYAICVDRRGMNECRGMCDLDGTTMRLTRSRDDHPETVQPEGLDRHAAERLARALAPMRDRLTLAGAQTAVPYPVRFLDLLDISVPAGGDVLSRWAANDGPTTRVVLGADGSGAVHVDLDRQGPHTMLGGATGAGKSILLQTLVTSLLLANRPDEVNLVLVDFKGGSAFLPFQRCPQVVALIRSTGETPADVFDEAAAKRVLDSVRAEVRRRESLLAPYGGEIDVYWQNRGTPAVMPALPRLVMIFDEFARVLEVSPDFLKELVNVAAKGRSLGMHLVLATQSLQGKLSAELKNNISLRITLRQNESADSLEVLGVPDAATIPGRLRGRGMILCTKDETRTPRLFQSGYLGDPPPSGGAAPARVRITEWPVLGTPRPDDPVDHGKADTDQQLAIAAIEVAAQRLGLPVPFRPLLPPLPADLPLEELESWSTAPPSASALPFGLLDDPDAQAQPAASLDLAGTDRLLIAGGPQSGRTTAVHALVAALATRFRPDQAHLYVVEHQPGGLSTYATLPHCGAVFSPAEPDRVRRFVTWLDTEVQRRTGARFGTGEPAPSIVVVIDGWEHFENRGDPAFVETSLLTTLRGVITAGTPVGVHVVATGGQDMMSGKLPTLYSQRLLLRFPKEDTRRQHLPSGVVTPPSVPGRAVDASTGRHVQVCRPQSAPEELVAQANAQLPRPDPARMPRQFPSMPTRITIHDLRAPEPPPSATWIPFGVGGPAIATIGMDLFDAGPHLVLVSGPGGSGRTTAAAILAHRLRRVGVGVLAVAPPRSPLAGLLPDDAGVRMLTGTTIKDTELRDAAEAFGDGPYAVVVDDCEQITVTAKQEGFTDVPTLLQEIASPGALGRHALVLCGDATSILTGQRRSLTRVVNEVMTDGTRVLLTPTSPFAAREHGFNLERDQFFAGPPGRGYLTTGRAVDLVHLAIL